MLSSFFQGLSSENENTKAHWEEPLIRGLGDQFQAPAARQTVLERDTVPPLPTDAF